MSVIGFALEHSDSPSGSSGEADEFTTKHIVEVDSFSDGPITVAGALGLPQKYQPYITASESHPFAICMEQRYDRLAPNLLIWVVESDFKTMDKKTVEQMQQEKTDPQGPLLEIPEISIDPEIYQEVVDSEFDEDFGPQEWELAPLRNSAKDLLSPPPMRDAERTVLTIERNEVMSTLHPGLQIAYRLAVNADVFWGQEPGVARFAGISVRRQTKRIEAGPFTGLQIAYLRVKYIIKFQNPSVGAGWNIKPLDAGPRYLVSGDNVARQFLDRAGHPYIGLLDGEGGPLGGLDANNRPLGPGDAEPVYLPETTIYRPLPFSVLQLPQSFPAL